MENGLSCEVRGIKTDLVSGRPTRLSRFSPKKPERRSRPTVSWFGKRQDAVVRQLSCQLRLVKGQVIKVQRRGRKIFRRGMGRIVSFREIFSLGSSTVVCCPCGTVDVPSPSLALMSPSGQLPGRCHRALCYFKLGPVIRDRNHRHFSRVSGQAFRRGYGQAAMLK